MAGMLQYLHGQSCAPEPGAITEDTLFGRSFRTISGMVGLVGMATLGYAVAVEPRTLRLRQFRVGVPELPVELEGLRVAFLSDFHVGGPGPCDDLTQQAIELVAQEQPELVLLGGDYVDHGHWSEDAPAFNELKGFTHVIGVLGNHDHKGGRRTVTAVKEGLEHRGVVMLRNQSVNVRVRDTDVTIAGVDDPYTGHDDFEKALRGVERPLILLSHAPVIEDELRPGMAGMILCGHTHGGQIRLSPSKTLTPLDSTFYLDHFFGRPVSKYQRGFHWAKGNLLYVSNGIGMTRWPIRFMAPPEVAIFHLTTDIPHQDEPCDSADRYVEDIG